MIQRTSKQVRNLSPGDVLLPSRRIVISVTPTSTKRTRDVVTVAPSGQKSVGEWSAQTWLIVETDDGRDRA